jgi:carbonic anhydrase
LPGFDDVLAANAAYADAFTLGGLAPRAQRGLCVLTCMDSRIEPLGMFGLRPGDAKILRNAGGRVTPDALRSLVLATSLLGVYRVVVMQHTLCALAGKTDSDLAADVRSAVGTAVDVWLGAFPDPDEALAQDVAAVRNHSLLPTGIIVEGWRYDVSTGRVARVVTAE